jgi:AraC-like DNA-binding protein
MREGFRVERSELAGEPQAIVGLALALIERGEARARIAEGGEVARLAAGDVLVVAQGHGGALFTRRGSACVLVFRAQGEWLARALALAGFALDSAPPRAATLRAPTEAARRAARLLRELAGADGVPGVDPPLVRASRALELVALALEAREPAPAPALRRRSPRGVALAGALDRLAEEPLQDVTLARFAASLGFSQRQVSRLVRERLGRSFGEHVATLRLARAQRLLAESDLSVIEVAAEAGFGSLAHFNQVFRARTGRTPSGFRAAARAAPA